LISAGDGTAKIVEEIQVLFPAIYGQWLDTEKQKGKTEVAQSDNPVAYLLAYTLRFNHNGKDTETDHFLIFTEYDEHGNSPEKQAQIRLDELIQQYDNDESATELYTWNIAAITKTNEWYQTGTATNNLSLMPELIHHPIQWDNVEVQDVKDCGNGVCDVVDDGTGDFTSVYLHDVEGGVFCIADLPNAELANQLADIIRNAVSCYKDNGYIK